MQIKIIPIKKHIHHKKDYKERKIIIIFKKSLKKNNKIKIFPINKHKL